MICIERQAVKNIRDDLSKYPHYLIGELRGILNFLIETHASIKKEPKSPALKIDNQEAVGLELPDHLLEIPANYRDKCIKIIMQELIDCADPLIISNGNGFKTVHY